MLARFFWRPSPTGPCSGLRRAACSGSSCPRPSPSLAIPLVDSGRFDRRRRPCSSAAVLRSFGSGRDAVSVAVAIDERLGLRDRLSTAVQIDRRDDPFRGRRGRRCRGGGGSTRNPHFRHEPPSSRRPLTGWWVSPLLLFVAVGVWTSGAAGRPASRRRTSDDGVMLGQRGSSRPMTRSRTSSP